jgi:NitT/TauT family transport system substrate-binding protein
LVYLPTTLAERLGYYRDEGLNVELQDFPGGAKALEALLGGSADVVSGFFDHTIQMAAEGRQLIAFVSMLRYPGLVLVVSPSAGRSIHSVEDLAGTNVGVSAPGSSTHHFLNHLLVKHGLTRESVSAIGVGMAAGSVAAMEAGRVHAAVMAEPAISQLEKRRGALRVLAETQTVEGVRAAYGVDAYPAAVLYSASTWVSSNEILAQRLARAIRRTLSWIQSHPASEIAAKMPGQFHGGDLELYVRAIERSKHMYSPDGVMPASAADAAYRVMAESMPKVRSASFDVSRCYTNRFVEQ